MGHFGLLLFSRVGDAVAVGCIEVTSKIGLENGGERETFRDLHLYALRLHTLLTITLRHLFLSFSA